MRTKNKLAEALRKIGLNDMAERAATGYYDDYESELAAPCIQLVADLSKSRKQSAQELLKRVKNGEFDATKEERDEWYQNKGRHLLNLTTNF